MEKKVHFKLHKVKKHWVTITVTGLALGLSFAGLNYASAEEQPTPVNEATVEAIIKEGAVDVDVEDQLFRSHFSFSPRKVFP